MKKLLTTIIVATACFFVSAQTIATYVGGGTSNSDGVPATSAKCPLPASGAFDGQGNYYYMQTQTYIRRVNPATGIVVTVAGSSSTTSLGDGGPATNAYLHCQYFDVDSTGNIYIADS